MITTLFKFTDNLNYKNWQIGRRRKNIVDLQLLTIDSEFKFVCATRDFTILFVSPLSMTYEHCCP